MTQSGDACTHVTMKEHHRGGSHVLFSLPSRGAGPQLCPRAPPTLPSRGAVGVAPCGTGRHEWPDGRGRGAEAASGLQEPEVCVRGGGSPFLPATRRAGAGRGEASGAAQTRAPSDPTRRGWALSLSGPRFRSHRGAAGSEKASDALRGCPPDFPWAEGGPQGEASAWVTKNCYHNQDRE